MSRTEYIAFAVELKRIEALEAQRFRCPVVVCKCGGTVRGIDAAEVWSQLHIFALDVEPHRALHR